MVLFIVLSISQDGFNSIKKIHKAFMNKQHALQFLLALNEENIYECHIIKQINVELCEE